MRTFLVVGLVGAVFVSGCAGRSAPQSRVPTPGPAPAAAPNAGADETDALLARDDGEHPAGADRAERRQGTWIGAAAESDFIDGASRETLMGVWIDVPDERPEARPPAQVALVVDTSGSMAGTKIVHARAAAARVVERLRDGDIVSLSAFSDDAVIVVAPTVLSPITREHMLKRIDGLRASGSTNMFAGLSLAESQIAQALTSHALRRIVLVSDGRATTGPTSAHVLGALAERGQAHRAQIAALGVGIDYDESTLNALAVRSSGRLHHIGDPRELEAVVKGELDLLERTVASDAFVEIVPAKGVRVEGAEGEERGVRHGNTLRLPLGALFAGQHREALVRLRIVDADVFGAPSRPLASVRLRFNDAQEGDLERVQEVVARGQLSHDPVAREAHAHPRTRAIVALQDAAKVKLEASRRVAGGDFAKADAELQQAEQRLVAEARVAQSAPEKKRLEAAATKMSETRTATRAMPTAAPAAQRDHALKLNADAMKEMGY